MFYAIPKGIDIIYIILVIKTRVYIPSNSQSDVRSLKLNTSTGILYSIQYLPKNACLFTLVKIKSESN